MNFRKNLDCPDYRGAGFCDDAEEDAGYLRRLYVIESPTITICIWCQYANA